MKTSLKKKTKCLSFELVKCHGGQFEEKKLPWKILRHLYILVSNRGSELVKVPKFVHGNEVVMIAYVEKVLFIWSLCDESHPLSIQSSSKNTGMLQLNILF